MTSKSHFIHSLITIVSRTPTLGILNVLRHSTVMTGHTYGEIAATSDKR